MRSRPDVLVLGGGGVLGEAWMMGVLAGIEDGTGFDLRDCDYYVGTSAGSIVAAHLVAGQPPRRPSTIGSDLDPLPSAPQPADGLAAAGLAAARRAGAVGARRRRDVRAAGARPGRARRRGGAGRCSCAGCPGPSRR